MNQSFRPMHPVSQPPLDPATGGMALNALLRGKWVILLVSLCFVALGWVYASRWAAPVYQATAVLMLDARVETVVDLGNVVSGLGRDEVAVNTEVEVLKSHLLAGQVVDTLDLTLVPEFNPRVLPETEPGLASFLHNRLVNLYLAMPPDTNAPTPEALREESITRLLDQLTIRSLPGSFAFTITAYSEDPELSVQIANTLAAHYFEAQLELKSTATRQATDWLAGRVVDLKLDLELAERQEKSFVASTDIVDADALASATRQLAALRTRMAEVPGQAEMLSVRVEELAARLQAQAADIVRHQQYQREAEASRQIYEYFLTRYKETAVQQGMHQPDSRLISPATTPRTAAWPNAPLILMLSLLAGLFTGAGFVIARSLRLTAFRSAAELEAETGYTVFGQIPVVPRRHGKRLFDHIVQNPFSILAEAVRDLRTSLLLADTPPQVILTSSAVPGEGKTTQSLLLAQQFAVLGRRVLLIEADMRRRSLSRMFGLANPQGLLAALDESVPLDDLLVRPVGALFDILPGESAGANAADVFASDPFAQLLVRLRATFDVIIIDAAPVLIVPDARVIAPMADSVLFCVRWDHTCREDVRRGLHQLETIRQRPAGLVLSRIDAQRMERPGYGGTPGMLARKTEYSRG